MEVLHEINIGRFWKLLVSNIRKFAIAWGIAAAWALMIGFSTPRTYMSEVKLAPESGQSALGGLSSLGSMMGIKVGGLDQDDAILPTLYPDVLKSPDFLLEVMKVKVSTKDGTVKDVDYKTYLTKHCKSTWWSAGFNGLMGLLKSKETATSIVPSGDGEGSQLIMLTRTDGELLKGLEKAIQCDVDKKTDVISIKVIDQDPLVAAILVDSISTRLQAFITNYRTKKARGEVKHLQKLYDKAYVDYQKAQKDYAGFADAHTDVVLSQYKVKEEDLENEVQLKYNVYSQVAVQLKAAESKVLQRTPVYTTIQAAMVPYKHIAPKRMTILFLYLVLGTFICFLWVYYQERTQEAGNAR